MIQPETQLISADNSGAKKLNVIRLKGGSYRRYASIGDVVTVSIRAGKIELANKLLNRSWCVEGKVIKGKKRGRKIGFPTCNMSLNSYVVPKLGVYAVKVVADRLNKNGVANIGYRPTFNGQSLLLETNIFGINKNLYNKVLRVSFKKFIRPEKKFKNFKYLKKQINLDIKQAKK